MRPLCPVGRVPSLGCLRWCPESGSGSRPRPCTLCVLPTLIAQLLRHDVQLPRLQGCGGLQGRRCAAGPSSPSHCLSRVKRAACSLPTSCRSLILTRLPPVPPPLPAPCRAGGGAAQGERERQVAHRVRHQPLPGAGQERAKRPRAAVSAAAVAVLPACLLRACWRACLAPSLLTLLLLLRAVAVA